MRIRDAGGRRWGERPVGVVAATIALFVIGTAGWLSALAVGPTAIGWKPVVVTSGSMTPRIQPGDVVVAAPVHHRVGPGTVVVFRPPGGAGLVTHRVVSVHEDGSYLTKGDANGQADSTPVPADAVVGVGRVLVPKVGLAPLWIRLQQWLPLAALTGVVAGAGLVVSATGPSAARRVRRRSCRRLRPLLAGGATGLGVFAVLVVPSTPAAARFTGTTANSTSWFATTASPTCSTPGTSVTVSPDADAFVQQDKPTTNLGSESTIDVKSSVGKNIRGLIHFPLPAPPAGCRVTDARLSMKTTTFRSGRVIQVVRTATPWSESGPTWNAHPATVGPVAEVPTVDGWTTWDVTQQIDDSHRFGNHGLLLRDSIEDAAGSMQNKYSSREGADPPSLVVTYG